MSETRDPFAVVDATGAELSGLASAHGEDAQRLADLFERGTPLNTRIAYERDMAYAAAWKKLAFDEGLHWPERREVAIRFVLDHSEDMAARPSGDPHRCVMEALVRKKLKRSISSPAPSTLDRYISSWRTMHRLRGLGSPFDDPLVKTQLMKARRANARVGRARKSKNPVTRSVLDQLLAPIIDDAPGLRDRAIFLFAWASGGRRPSEVSGLHYKMLDLKRYETAGVIDIRLHGTKTTIAGETPALLIRGAAADAMKNWLTMARISEGWVFRRIDRLHRVSEAPLTTHGLNYILRRRLEAAGLDPAFASAHGFRSGFMTDCSKLGISLSEAMRLSLHKSVAQAVSYYQEAELDENAATRLI